MANSPPASPGTPDDPLPPGGPPEPGERAKSGSLADSDWFRAIPELPAPKSGKLPPIPSDAEIDLSALFAGAAEAGPPSLTGVPPLHPAADTPRPVAPASGWLTPAPASDDGEPSDIFSGVRGRTSGDSDVFGGPRGSGDSGLSNIFDAPPAGSSRMDRLLHGHSDDHLPDPGGTTSIDAGALEAAAGPNGSDDLFLSFDQPPSELFADDPAVRGHFDDGSKAFNNLMDELHLPFTPPGSGRPSRPGKPPSAPSVKGPATPNSDLDFNETSKGESSSNLFDDLTDADFTSLNSAVDLLNPDGDVVTLGGRPPSDAPGAPESSIFQKRPESSLVDMDQIPLMGSSDDKTEAMHYTGADVDGTSSIFQHGGQADAGDSGLGAGLPGGRSSVPLGSPSRHGPVVRLGPGDSGAATDDASAAIDWALPGHPAQPAAKRDGSDSEADLSGLDDDVHATARMAPSSGIFDVDMTKETPLGSLSGSYPAKLVQSSASGFLTPAPRPAAPRSGVNPAGPPSAAKSGKARAPQAKPATRRVEAPVPRKARGGLGWLGGTAVGLMAGVGACSALYLSGAIPSGPSMAAPLPRPAAPGLTAPVEGAAADLPDARRLLAAGDAERALPAFEAAGDAADPADLARRGLARWLVRQREMAQTGKKIDPDDKFLRAALADLERAAGNPELLKTDDGREAALRAVVYLGVTKELTGDAAGAAAHYAAAAKKYPRDKALFDGHARRLQMAAGAGKVALAPPDAAGLVAALVAVTLFQDAPAPVPAPAPAAGSDEPALHFWDAAARAAAGDYPAALAALKKARALHDARRLRLAGRGLSPLTDPVEQLFLKCCDEIAAGWTLRQQLYADPVAGPVFAKSGVAAGLKQLAAAAKPDPKAAQQLAAAVEQVKAKDAEVATAKQELAAAQAKERELTDKLQAATTEATTNGKAKDETTAKLAEAAKAAAATRDKLAAAEQAAKTATDAVATVVAGLKAGKVVGPDEDAAAVVKNLPEIVRKVVTASDSADAQKAAAAYAAAVKELDALRTASAKATEETKAVVAKADTKVADAMKRVEAARAEAEQTRAAAEAERKQAVADAAVLAKRQLDEQKSAYEAKIAEAARDVKRAQDDARAQVANARAGVAVPLTSSDLVAKEQAARLYGQGADRYFQGRYAEAEALLADAVTQDGEDARYWYLLGLSRFAQGKADAESFRKGVEQERLSRPTRREVDSALEKVQGKARDELRGFRR